MLKKCYNPIEKSFVEVKPTTLPTISVVLVEVFR